MSETTPDVGLFAQRLEHLFDTVRPAGKKRYTNPDVADAINEAAGEQVISQAYIWQLRKGKKTNPGYQHISALASFFGVPPQYFFGDQAAGSNSGLETDVQVALRDGAVRDVAFRAAGLSEETLKTIQDMIDRARTLEGLPAVDPVEHRPARR